ncbi:MAG: IPT/TIG domain-containing protein [Holophaga sp.]|nr:IPT/TIG domain-containing protein [Holophaga sp.]
METAMIKSSSPSPLGAWLRRARMGVVLPGLVLGVILGCGAGTSTTAPTITSVTPLYGAYGTAVTVTGTGFSNTLKNVYFNGVGVTTGTYTSDTSVTVDVPAAATTGSISAVTSGGTATYAEEFVVLPYNVALSTSSGVAGSTVVTVSGYGLMGISTIYITGDSSPITLLTQTANSITFQIPSNATVATTDEITINVNSTVSTYGATPWHFNFTVTS